MLDGKNFPTNLLYHLYFTNDITERASLTINFTNDNNF